MILLKAKDPLSREIVLEDTQWNHIVLRHPEMSEMFDELPGLISTPDIIVESTRNHQINIFQKKIGEYYLSLVVQAYKNFIITGYLSFKIKKGVVLWQKN